MGAIDRKPIFDATRAIVRHFVPDWNFNAADVGTLDQGIDAAIAVLEAVPAPPAAPPAPALEDTPRTGLRNAAAFFDALRTGKLLGPALAPSEVNGCSAILAACGKARWPVSFAAYALATAYHETAHSMQPIHELGGEAYLRRMYDIAGNRPTKARELGNTTPGDGIRYAGRGYVQLTGKMNYAKAGAVLGVDLVGNPDAAMQPDNAAEIMANGMQLGWFTGKKLADYLTGDRPGTTADFKQARRIINGQDRADDIAGYAIEFQRALGLGDWS